jgi:hypothetical protein
LRWRSTEKQGLALTHPKYSFRFGNDFNKHLKES